MLMLFPPAGIPHLLSKPVLQQSHTQSKPHFAFATQTGAQSCSLPLKNPQPTNKNNNKVVLHYMHKGLIKLVVVISIKRLICSQQALKCNSSRL